MRYVTLGTFWPSAAQLTRAAVEAPRIVLQNGVVGATLGAGRLRAPGPQACVSEAGPRN
jgi:hypothetical protein